MIRIKLQANKRNNIIFKIKIDDKYSKNILFKRAIMEGKKLDNKFFNYEIPLRFFIPICSNLNEDEIVIDRNSILEYFEFSDFYDENYYTELTANAKYMKKWREEGCPDIYKISINKDTHKIVKEIAFKKPSLSLGKLKI